MSLPPLGKTSWRKKLGLARYCGAGYASGAWGRSGCVVESEDAEAAVQVQLGLGGLPGHADRFGIGRAGGFADVTEGAEERRRDTDPSDGRG